MLRTVSKIAKSGPYISFYKAQEYKEIVEKSLCGGMITLDTFKNRSRSPEFSHVRFEAWMILHIEYSVSYSMIGRLYNLDHSSVMHGIDRIARLKIENRG